MNRSIYFFVFLVCLNFQKTFSQDCYYGRCKYGESCVEGGCLTIKEVNRQKDYHFDCALESISRHLERVESEKSNYKHISLSDIQNQIVSDIISYCKEDGQMKNCNNLPSVDVINNLFQGFVKKKIITKVGTMFGQDKIGEYLRLKDKQTKIQSEYTSPDGLYRLDFYPDVKSWSISYYSKYSDIDIDSLKESYLPDLESPLMWVIYYAPGKPVFMDLERHLDNYRSKKYYDFYGERDNNGLFKKSKFDLYETSMTGTYNPRKFTINLNFHLRHLNENRKLDEYSTLIELNSLQNVKIELDPFYSTWVHLLGNRMRAKHDIVLDAHTDNQKLISTSKMNQLMGVKGNSNSCYHHDSKQELLEYYFRAMLIISEYSFNEENYKSYSNYVRDLGENQLTEIYNYNFRRTDPLPINEIIHNVFENKFTSINSYKTEDIISIEPRISYTNDLIELLICHGWQERVARDPKHRAILGPSLSTIGIKISKEEYLNDEDYKYSKMVIDAINKGYIKFTGSKCGKYSESKKLDDNSTTRSESYNVKYQTKSTNAELEKLIQLLIDNGVPREKAEDINFRSKIGSVCAQYSGEGGSRDWVITENEYFYNESFYVKDFIYSIINGYTTFENGVDNFTLKAMKQEKTLNNFFNANLSDLDSNSAEFINSVSVINNIFSDNNKIDSYLLKNWHLDKDIEDSIDWRGGISILENQKSALIVTVSSLESDQKERLITSFKKSFGGNWTIALKKIDDKRDRNYYMVSKE